MAVEKSKRGENKFEVFLKARELAVYTNQITQNRNVFKRNKATATVTADGKEVTVVFEQDPELLKDIVHSANQIFLLAWKANNIMVKDDAEKWKMRSSLQQEAILECNSLLAMVQLAYKVFHLSGKRIEFWAKSVVEVRGLLRNWHDGDQNRYGNL